CVSDSCYHVCYWICHNHSPLPPSRIYLYQLAFLTPGIRPLCASSRKQSRHKLNLRITECGRPQRSQRVYSCTLNFCRRCCFAIIDFLATNFPPQSSLTWLLLKWHSKLCQ